MLQDNIDLNIWDKVGYETDCKQIGWAIMPYTIKEKGGYYGSGNELPVHELLLTEEEAKQLTLGVSKEDGGHYASDYDFWMDLNTFLLTYQNIPDRVLEWAKATLEVVYNMAEQESQDYMEAKVF
jgi:hypothetical protein